MVGDLWWGCMWGANPVVGVVLSQGFAERELIPLHGCQRYSLRILEARVRMEPMSTVGTSHGDVLGAVIEASYDAVIVCDRQACIVMWNETSGRLFGYRAESVIGRPLADLFALHVRDEVVAVVERGQAGERIVGFESETVRGDGLPVPVSVSMSPVGDEGGGGPRAVVAVVRDVTEQRLAQATLAEVEVRLREAEAMAHVGSWLWDTRTDVVQWSVEFHRLHGLDPLDFGGTLASYLGVVHPDDRAALERAMQGAVTDRRPFEIEYRVRGHGRVFVGGQPTVSSAGAVVGLRGVGRSVQS